MSNKLSDLLIALDTSLSNSANSLKEKHDIAINNISYSSLPTYINKISFIEDETIEYITEIPVDRVETKLVKVSGYTIGELVGFIYISPTGVRSESIQISGFDGWPDGTYILFGNITFATYPEGEDAEPQLYTEAGDLYVTIREGYMEIPLGGIIELSPGERCDLFLKEFDARINCVEVLDLVADIYGQDSEYFGAYQYIEMNNKKYLIYDYGSHPRVGEIYYVKYTDTTIDTKYRLAVLKK